MRAAIVALLLLLLWTPQCLLADIATTQPATRPTLWLVGDSTMRNGTKGQQGWGDPINELFDADRIRVENRARGGRSSRTFRTEGLWKQVVGNARPGDFVLIQLGHNDAGPIVDESRNRGTLRGIGNESEEVAKPDGTKEVVRTYGWYLRQYIREARDKGMSPIVCSYGPRCPKPGATIVPDPKPVSYRLWAKEVAEQEGAAFIDLYALIWRRYATSTPEQLKADYFTEADFTHTNPAGAQLNAEAVAEGIRALKDVPLAAYLK